MNLAPRRAPATLVLGTLSGALAAITVMATSIPIARRLGLVEESLYRKHAVTAVEVGARILEIEGGFDQTTRADLQVTRLQLIQPGEDIIVHQGPDLDPILIDMACAEESQLILDSNSIHWALACKQVPQGQLIAAFNPSAAPTNDIFSLMLMLSALVGIVTAMGVLSFLRPLNQMSTALDRVRAGERGVRVEYTGLTELDELVDHLNLAAQGMEEREDAIVARIQVVQQLARLVAHEVRNPLQSLELLTSLIATEDNATERAELAGSLHAEISTLNAVVERLLSKDATRGALRLAMQKAPLLPTIEHVVRLRSPEATSRGTRIEIGDVSEAPVAFDSALLSRSIENLVINAMQIVPLGYGLIRVTVREEDENTIAISVEDNGPGVDPEFGAQIFEADVTTKESGTGLGLTLVRGVAEAHGGYIEYDDSPLGGARFTLRIPRVEVTADEVLAESTHS